MTEEIDWEHYGTRPRRPSQPRASTTIEDARVAYLGRKSPLALGLRDVRDRETGMLLNGIRTRLEEAAAAREQALAGDELDRRLREEVIDVTLPGEELPLGHLHPITQVRRAVEDAFLGLGYEVRDDREVETVEYNFDKLASCRRTRPARRATRSSSTRRTSCAPRRARRRSTSSRRSRRRSTWSRSAASTAATRSPRRATRSSTSSRGSPSTRGSPSPTCRGRCST